MRILYLAQRVPYPPNRGDKIITYHHVRHLARNHQVTVACLAADREELRNAERLAALVPKVYVARRSSLRGALGALAGSLGGNPLTVGYFGEGRLHRQVKQLLQGSTFDLAMVFSSGMAQFVEQATDLPRIIHFADLDSLKWKQYVAAVRPPRRWVYATEARRLLEYERCIAYTFDHSLVCTRSEAEDFRRLIPGASVSSLPNGVDLEYFFPLGTNGKKCSLVFTGVMDYLPNVAGVKWFCSEVFPLIRRHVPEVTLTISGARPTAEVRDLGKMPGVTVTGQVPDVRPYMARASVAVVPLQISRGIQNKVLESMAMGLPVVATPAAFQGLEAEPGTDLLVAEHPEDFAQCVVGLLRDEKLREAMGQRARSCMEQKYQWSTSLKKLDTIIQAVVGGYQAADRA